VTHLQGTQYGTVLKQKILSQLSGILQTLDFGRRPTLKMRIKTQFSGRRKVPVFGQTNCENTELDLTG